jgi:hypothetical protein
VSAAIENRKGAWRILARRTPYPGFRSPLRILLVRFNPFYPASELPRDLGVGAAFDKTGLFRLVWTEILKMMVA